MYDGSMTAWAGDPELPLVTGDSPLELTRPRGGSARDGVGLREVRDLLRAGQPRKVRAVAAPLAAGPQFVDH
ncbi:hypothetical protein GCM10009831_07510 [Dietzia cercidiphylli]|uniref:Uncharacterized protein n=1 Tax=Dietzia cercidiphylli TaxID=498199 RepID=A0ABN2IA53_9ACTN